MKVSSNPHKPYATIEESDAPLTNNNSLTMTHVAALIAASVAIAAPALADDAAARKWIEAEFQPSTLSKPEQLRELQWFEKAAQPFKGMEINIGSETLATHEYESRMLAKAFTEITGIKIKHDTLP